MLWGAVGSFPYIFAEIYTGYSQSFPAQFCHSILHPQSNHPLIICHKFNLQACGVEGQNYDYSIYLVSSSALMSIF